jgi:hypothetical protein
MGGTVAVIDIGLRDAERDQFVAATGIEFFHCDLASRQSIAAFVAAFAAKVHPSFPLPIDVHAYLHTT